MANGNELWNKVVTLALQSPGVKVYRDDFLRKQLNIYSTDAQMSAILEKGPIGIVPIEVLDKIAGECINFHTRIATTSSIALGMPGGAVIFATLPSDLAQYYYHVFVVAQKLAYIYGYPDLCDENGNFTEDSIQMLTVFVGIMSGVAAAQKVIQEIAEQVQKEILRRLPRYALTKTFLYPLVKQVAKWIGVSITKQSFARGISKIVPFVGGAVSGGLTYITFKPQSIKLQKVLKEKMLLAYESKKSESYDNAEEVTNG